MDKTAKLIYFPKGPIGQPRQTSARKEEDTEMKRRLEALVAEMVDRGMRFEDAVAEFEKSFILSVLKRTNGNLSRAADELRIHRNTLSKRVEKYYQNHHMIAGRHRRPKATAEINSPDRFPLGARERARILDDLSAEGDALLAQMQTPKARKGMKAAFNASPTQIGRAAVKAAAKPRKKLLDRVLRIPTTRAMPEKGPQGTLANRKG